MEDQNRYDELKNRYYAISNLIQASEVTILAVFSRLADVVKTKENNSDIMFIRALTYKYFVGLINSKSKGGNYKFKGLVNMLIIHKDDAMPFDLITIFNDVLAKEFSLSDLAIIYAGLIIAHPDKFVRGEESKFFINTFRHSILSDQLSEKQHFNQLVSNILSEHINNPEIKLGEARKAMLASDKVMVSELLGLETDKYDAEI
ncbi:MAG: hypothetical protein NTY12_01605 [Candidatus Falkowbacteria bacterium]|nr:hypothetical protein [Candidatus Falkowbacteria bacterium]